MPINFFPFPIEILRGEQLKNPKAGKNGGKAEPEMINFTFAHKIIFAAICELLNPLLYGAENNLNFSHQDIANRCRASLQTVKNVMPVLLFNFPQYFEINNARQFGKGFNYKFNYNFVMEFRASGQFNSSGRMDKFIGTLTANDLMKWELFSKIPLQYEHKRTQYFNSFQNNNFDFWARNIEWALKTLSNKPDWQGKVPNKWFWKCLEQDYGFNKLPKDKEVRKDALNNLNGVQQLKERGFDVDKIFKGKGV